MVLPLVVVPVIVQDVVLTALCAIGFAGVLMLLA